MKRPIPNDVLRLAYKMMDAAYFYSKHSKEPGDAVVQAREMCIQAVLRVSREQRYRERTYNLLYENLKKQNEQDKT